MSFNYLIQHLMGHIDNADAADKWWRPPPAPKIKPRNLRRAEKNTALVVAKGDILVYRVKWVVIVKLTDCIVLLTEFAADHNINLLCEWKCFCRDGGRNILIGYLD
jgi:hypothetical protein